MERPKIPKRALIRLLLITLALALVILGAYLLARHLGLTSMTAEEIRARVDATGAWGVLVYILVSFLQVTFIPVPFTVTVVAGSLLFSPIEAFFYSLVGSLLGSSLAFLLGRLLGRPFVNWAVGDRGTVDYYLKKAEGREFVVFFFTFLLPFFPDDALCAIAGITNLPTRRFLLIQVISRPLTIAGNLLFMTGTLIPFEGWWLLLWAAIVAATVVAFLLSMKYADRFSRFFDRLLERAAAPFTAQKNKGKEDKKE